MHKKKQSPLLRSLRNPNAFKKKSSKILKSLSPASNFSLQSPLKQKQSQELAKTKIKIERSRIISSEYALHYKEPPQQSFPYKQTHSQKKKQKECFKNAKILLNSALDVGEKGKASSMGKMGEGKKSAKNLSVSGSEWMKKKESQLTKQQSGKPIYDSQRTKRHSFFGKSNQKPNIIEENIKQLQILKNKNKKMFMNLLSKIKRKEDELEEEREKFMMVKEIYLEQIKKLTKSLVGKKGKKYKLPISSTSSNTEVDFKQPELSVIEDYHLKGYRPTNRKRIQTQ